jgi:anti-sigma factor RsiW
MKGERLVGGLLCSEVLAGLTEYLDGRLEPPVVERVNEHLRGCDLCERFGGEMAATVRSLREGFGEPPPLESEVEKRLRQRLAAEMASRR